MIELAGVCLSAKRSPIQPKTVAGMLRGLNEMISICFFSGLCLVSGLILFDFPV
jgi:hypothetical protein